MKNISNWNIVPIDNPTGNLYGIFHKSKPGMILQRTVMPHGTRPVVFITKGTAEDYLRGETNTDINSNNAEIRQLCKRPFTAKQAYLIAIRR